MPVSLVWPFYAACDPLVSVEKHYYDVKGRTEVEIRKSLDANTPVLHNGKKFDAYTRWHVHWNFWWNESGNSCAITRVRVSADIRVTLPRLSESPAVPNALIKKWNLYMVALQRHEDGHKSIGVKAAGEIEKQIKNISPGRSCEKLKIDANRLAHSILETYRRLEINYDRRTHHGMKDGAIFP